MRGQRFVRRRQFERQNRLQRPHRTRQVNDSRNSTRLIFFKKQAISSRGPYSSRMPGLSAPLTLREKSAISGHLLGTAPLNPVGRSIERLRLVTSGKSKHVWI